MNRLAASIGLAGWVLAGSCASPGERVRLVGLELFARDLPACVQFYRDGLAFEVEEAAGGRAVLRSGSLRLVLSQSGEERDGGAPVSCGPYLNMRVAELEGAVRVAAAAGGRTVGEGATRNAIGVGRKLLDPAGNELNLMQLDAVHGEHGGPPAVFNIGLRMRDLAEAERRFGSLGFEVPTRAYLPRTLPLASPGGPSLAVHARADACEPARARLLLDVATLEGVEGAGVGPIEHRPDGSTRSVTLPGGLRAVVSRRNASP